ncbi:uncharacterized protein LOC112348871 [Selaginella moellendorffii]|uniref:uncharacterized protein LOC112348871 n=1 Tax=Selaginella moellendorffii TaxID=88036 RepID=UPI000D1C8538|nr:uncharacterized protein LOC112348871 [Selaginella moellendorffii]|eukprot:XP_024537950.1 uncharacterized protein LOC112348871 [Selaginella moellendorffii]
MDVSVPEHDFSLSEDLSGTMRSLKQASGEQDIGVPADSVNRVNGSLQQVITNLNDVCVKVPLLKVIFLPIIIILEIIVIYVPGGYPCPQIIIIICKYFGNAFPVWSPFRYIRVDATIIVSIQGCIRIVQNVIVIVRPNSCIYFVLNGVIYILQSGLALLYAN